MLYSAAVELVHLQSGCSISCMFPSGSRTLLALGSSLVSCMESSASLVKEKQQYTYITKYNGECDSGLRRFIGKVHLLHTGHGQAKPADRVDC